MLYKILAGIVLVAVVGVSVALVIANQKTGAEVVEEEVVKNNTNNMENKNPQTALIETSLGNIKVQFYSSDAPKTVANFAKLAEKENAAAVSIASLYQLGLLSQWAGDLEGAKAYYDKLLEKAGEGFVEAVALAKERLKEIEESLPIEFNLKAFLDASLKEERDRFKMEKVELKPNVYDANLGQDIEISATSNMMQTGCLQVEMSYLWSGDLGQAKPATEKPAFHTTYSDSGTKVIGLVVVSPDGIVDRGFDLVDIE